jgi:RimJ/RimL family protein N-acetyltransferase
MCAIEITPAISTERLLLRGPVANDAARITELANDINVAGRVSRMPYPYGIADAEAWLETVARSDWDRDAVFAIEHHAFGLVGMIGVTHRNGERPELGYWLGRPFWNRGYATEAARAALKWVKRDWRKRLVVSGHFSDNPASGAVLCKAGFLYTGEVELRPCLARGGAKVPTRMMVWLA